MAKSVSFRCPHCGRVQAKSAIDQMMGGAYSISLDSPVVICVACGRPIDRASITSGQLDAGSGGCVTGILELGGGGLLLLAAAALAWWLWKFLAGS